MKHFFSSLLSFLFPRERRAHSVERITPETLFSLTHHRQRIVQDAEIRTIFSYKEPLVRDLMWALKYEKSRHAAKLLGTALSDTLLEELTEDALFAQTPPLLIPIPLAPQRERMRGYNQVLWIAQETASRLPGTLTMVPDVLTRIRETDPQTALLRKERLKNVQGAFAVSNAALISGRSCIVLDDIATTGSTLCEARRTLMEAGAKRVTCMALASAD